MKYNLVHVYKHRFFFTTLTRHDLSLYKSFILTLLSALINLNPDFRAKLQQTSAWDRNFSAGIINSGDPLRCIVDMRSCVLENVSIINIHDDGITALKCDEVLCMCVVASHDDEFMVYDYGVIRIVLKGSYFQFYL